MSHYSAEWLDRSYLFDDLLFTSLKALFLVACHREPTSKQGNLSGKISDKKKQVSRMYICIIINDKVYIY